MELWPPEEAPGLAARAALVLGAERGSWPVAPRADPLLGDPARGALNRRLGRRALATSAVRQAEAEYLGLSALAAAREVLAVGFTRGPGGEGPAPLVDEVLARGEAADACLAADPPLGRARSAAEAIRAAARLCSAGEGARALRALAAVPREWAPAAGEPDLAGRAAAAAARGALEGERRQAWIDGRAVPAAGAVPPGLAPAWASALPGEWSATQLETHARCPYRLFLQVAGVPEPDEGGIDMSSRDEGSLVHAVLEAFLRARRDRGAWPPRGTDGDRAEASRIAAVVFARFEAEGRVGDPGAWGARREAVRRRVLRWVDAEARDHGGLRPVLLEYEFGGASGRPPVVVPGAAGEIRLRGRIDRVDADDSHLLVIDYKNSRGEREHRERLGAEALGLTSFQPPLYLLAASCELPGRSNLAATYGLLRSTERVEPWRTGPRDGFLALDPARREQVRAAGERTFADAVEGAVGRIASGEMPVASRDCTGCPFGVVCRFPQPGSGA